MQCCCFSSELISSLCPWNFKLKLLYFSDFCVHLCVNLMFSPCMQLLTSLLVVLVILYCLLLLLVILLCFMQVRCIVRNIVRDWAEEVIFCSTVNNLKQSSFSTALIWKYYCFFYNLCCSRVKRNVMSATSPFLRSLIIFFLTGAIRGKPSPCCFNNWFPDLSAVETN